MVDTIIASGLAGSVSELSSSASGTEPTGLSAQQKEFLISELQQEWKMPRSTAERLINDMPADKASKFHSLVVGGESIGRDEAVAMWNLSPEEADALFPNGTVLGTFTNPFGRAFLLFLQLAYALDVDMKKILSDLLQVQIQAGLAKAEDTFRGAISQFATSMVAAAVTIGCAGVCLFKAHQRNKEHKAIKDKLAQEKDPNSDQARQLQNDLNKAATDNMWFGPIGASLINQPITAAGEFDKAWYELQAAYEDAIEKEATAQYQHITSLHDSVERRISTVSEGLK